MTRSISTALLLGLFAVVISQSAVAETAGNAGQVSQLGNSKQFGTIKVTLESFAIQGGKEFVVLRMDNVGDEAKEIALLLFIDVHSETGELGDYDYAKPRCDGAIPPKGSFECKLPLVFPAAPKQISIKVGEGMAGDTVTFNIPTSSPERGRPDRSPLHGVASRAHRRTSLWASPVTNRAAPTRQQVVKGVEVENELQQA